MIDKESLKIANAWIELAELLCRYWYGYDFSIKKYFIRIFIRQLKELNK